MNRLFVGTCMPLYVLSIGQASIHSIQPAAKNLCGLPNVAANRENDRYFEIGFAMGIADCRFYAALDKIP